MCLKRICSLIPLFCYPFVLLQAPQIEVAYCRLKDWRTKAVRDSMRRWARERALVCSLAAASRCSLASENPANRTVGR